MTTPTSEIVRRLRRTWWIAPNKLEADIDALTNEAASRLEALEREIEATRSILAAGDSGSLPTYYPTYQMAADRMRELDEARAALSKARGDG